MSKLSIYKLIDGPEKGLFIRASVGWENN